MDVRKFVIAAAFILLLTPLSTARAASSDEQEIEQFIASLYEAKEKGDEERLVSLGASEVQIMSALTLADCGIQGYRNLDPHIYRGGGNTWFVIVVYDMEVEGLDVWIPGIETEYVIRNSQGELLLPWQTEEDPPGVNKLAELTQTDPEIAELFESCNDSYYQLLENDIEGKIADFNQNVRETFDKILEERISITEDSSQDEESGRNKLKRFYTVRTGDCLWSIAEKYFGSGGSWTLLYEKNREIIGDSPNLIYPGQRLELDIS